MPEDPGERSKAIMLKSFKVVQSERKIFKISGAIEEPMKTFLSILYINEINHLKILIIKID